MKALTTFVLSMALLAGMAIPALGAPPERCITGREYGKHVSMHAKMAHFGPGMNPGMHRGFSGYCEHHHHGDM